MTQAEIRKMAEELMNSNKANKNIYAVGWRFAFNDRKGAFGLCRYKPKLIEYSLHFLNESTEKIKDTILHEIAHAVAGSDAKHGPVWKYWAKVLGADPSACHKANAETERHLASIAKYVAVCPSCKNSVGANKKRTRRSSCPHCSGGRFNPQFELIFKPNTKTNNSRPSIQSVPKPNITTINNNNVTIKVGDELMVKGVNYVVVEITTRNPKRPVIVKQVGRPNDPTYKMTKDMAVRCLIIKNKKALA